MFLLFTTDNDSFQGGKSSILERLDVNLGFFAFNLEELGTCAGMSGSKDGAAILVGEDGGFKGVDLSGDTDDLFFVHADQRAEYGAFHNAVGNAERLHGLACDLTEAFARDQCIAFVFRGSAFCKTHHKATEQESEVILLAVVTENFLNFRYGNDMYVDLSRKFGELFCEGENLFFCAFAGIGEAFEMHGIETNAALGDHEACNGAVDTAGEEEKSLAVGADGHTADCLFLTCADISGVITNLYADGDLGVVNVHALSSVGFLKNYSADLCGNFGRGEREFLVGALCFYLEGARVLDVGHELRFHGVQDGIHILFRFDGAVDCGNTEGVFCNAVSAVDICVFVERLDVYGALHGVDFEIAVGSGSALQNVTQKLFEVRTVCSLKGDLAVFAKNDLFHYAISFPISDYQNKITGKNGNDLRFRFVCIIMESIRAMRKNSLLTIIRFFAHKFNP